MSRSSRESDMRIGVSMPCLNTRMAQLPELAAQADQAGFESVWSCEFYKNPLKALAHAAVVTDRIELGTAIVQAGPRTPFEMANAAADVDELSGGRLTLGLGLGGPDWMATLHGLEVDHPLGRMREYLDVFDLAYRYLGTHEPATYEGSFYRFENVPLNPWGKRELVRPRVPIYLAAMKPLLMQLAGERGDGLMGYLFTPKVLREYVYPNVEKGARRAGRDPRECDVAALTICSVHPDRAEAVRRARFHVGYYVAYELSDGMVAMHGLEQDQALVRQALVTEGPDALERATSDELIEAFSLTGTPDEVRRQLSQFDGLLPRIIMHTPYVPPLSTEECVDAYQHILETFAH